jgi:hypothetical protein
VSILPPLVTLKKLTCSTYRRHVFADLKPYICTFSNCKDELLTFPTRKLWEEHEFGQHRIEKCWKCLECPRKLHSPDEWESHLESQHGRVLSKPQRNLTLPVVEIIKEQDIESQACPLCLEMPGKTRRVFVAHLAKHMEGIALAALPRESDPGSETQSNSSSDIDVNTNVLIVRDPLSIASSSYGDTSRTSKRSSYGTSGASEKVREYLSRKHTEASLITATETKPDSKILREQSLEVFSDNEQGNFKGTRVTSRFSSTHPRTNIEQPQSSFISPTTASLSQDSGAEPPLFNIERDGDPNIKWVTYYDFMVSNTDAYYQLQQGYLPSDKYPLLVKAGKVTM